MITLAAIDIAIIIIFLLFVVWIGYYAIRKKSSASTEYLLAGRTLTLPMFVATLVSTWYGGILGVGEYSYRYGISNWIVFGVPYYFFAVIFALFIAKKVRSSGLVTIPDQFQRAYGKPAALFSAALTFILVSPAPYVLMMGILVQLIFGFSLPVSIIGSAAVTLCYLYTGGFRSDVYVNALEFIVMFAGFSVIIPFAYVQFGGIDYLRANLPPLHLTWNGGASWQFITVWFFIALWTLVDPAFYQRCYAAKDGKTAQKGILISTAFWFCFDAMTSIAGLYSRAALPELTQPMFAYPMLAELVLPSAAKGIFYVGMLATIMSTLSSLTFIGASTIGNDVIGRIWTGGSEEEKLKIIQRGTKTGLLVTAIVAISLSLIFPSVVRLWYSIGTVIVPGLLIPLVVSYFPKLKISGAFAFGSMMVGSGVSLVWFLAGQLNGGNYFLSVEPMFPGIIFSFIVWSLGRWNEKIS